jgi:hypothetical protein
VAGVRADAEVQVVAIGRRLTKNQPLAREAYCNEKHDLSVSYANRQIAAIPSVENLTPIGAKISTESHIREVVSLPPGASSCDWPKVDEKPAPCTREKRLYREDYFTWEDYCDKECNLSSRRANQLIETSTTVENVGKNFPKISTESHAQALSGLEPQQQVQVVAIGVGLTKNQPIALRIGAELETKQLVALHRTMQKPGV